MDLKQRLNDLENRTGLTDFHDLFVLIDDLFEFGHDAVNQLDEYQKQLEQAKSQLSAVLNKLDQAKSVIHILEDTNL